MAPQTSVQQHAMNEQRHRPRALLEIADPPRWSLDAVSIFNRSLSIRHSASPYCVRESIRFLQSLRALLAAHLNCLPADLDFDRIRIKPALAAARGSVSHNLLLYPRSG